MIFLNEDTHRSQDQISDELKNVLAEQSKQLALQEGEGDDEGTLVELEVSETAEGEKDEALNESEVAEMNAILTEEAPKTTRKVVVKTRKQKIALMTQTASMEMAKESKDPLYKQYEKARKLEVKLRSKIEAKYANKAKAAVRATIAAK